MKRWLELLLITVGVAFCASSISYSWTHEEAESRETTASSTAVVSSSTPLVSKQIGRSPKPRKSLPVAKPSPIPTIFPLSVESAPAPFLRQGWGHQSRDLNDCAFAAGGGFGGTVLAFRGGHCRLYNYGCTHSELREGTWKATEDGVKATIGEKQIDFRLSNLAGRRCLRYYGTLDKKTFCSVFIEETGASDDIFNEPLTRTRTDLPKVSATSKP